MTDLMQEMMVQRLKGAAMLDPYQEGVKAGITWVINHATYKDLSTYHYQGRPASKWEDGFNDAVLGCWAKIKPMLDSSELPT